ARHLVTMIPRNSVGAYRTSPQNRVPSICQYHRIGGSFDPDVILRFVVQRFFRASDVKLWVSFYPKGDLTPCDWVRNQAAIAFLARGACPSAAPRPHRRRSPNAPHIL